jgi:predicted RNase H-like nuclease
MKKKLKIFVLYRVIQHWRVLIFEKIAKVDFKLLHDPDFNGTKVVNSTGAIAFKSK